MYGWHCMILFKLITYKYMHKSITIDVSDVSWGGKCGYMLVRTESVGILHDIHHNRVFLSKCEFDFALSYCALFHLLER